MSTTPRRASLPATPEMREVTSGGWCPHCEREVAPAEALVMRSGRLRCPGCRKRIEERPPAGDEMLASGSGAAAAAAAAAAPGKGAAGQDRAGQDRAGQDHAGQDHAGQDHARQDEEELKAPWHFKILVAGTVIYLVYRLIWFVFWLTGHAWHG